MKLRVVYRGERGKRLDIFLTEEAAQQPLLAHLSRSQIKHLITEGSVTVDNSRVTKAGHSLVGGEVVEVLSLEPRRSNIEPFAYPLNICFEDDYLLVVDKPPGLTVHPGSGTGAETLVNALSHHFLATGSLPESFRENVRTPHEEVRPGIVHRLDKNTSGLLVVAKKLSSLRNLALQFSARTVERTYLALIRSHPRRNSGIENQEEGRIEKPIGRDPKVAVRMAVDGINAKHAATRWKVKEWMDHAALLSVNLETGRTHQIRVHLSAIGAPLIGDPTYGRINDLPPSLMRAMRHFGRQALHASSVGFSHPATNEPLFFHSPLPDDFVLLCEEFRK